MAGSAELSIVTQNVEAARAYAERKKNRQPPSPKTIGRGAIGITNNGQPMPYWDPWQNPEVLEILADHNPIEDDPDDELAWQKDGLCSQIDPEIFFKKRGVSTLMAKEICRMCDVTADCLDYALGNNEKFGIWGGLTRKERTKLQK
jgi:WhiB family redox-sensing transcriptional regulator